MKLLIGTTNPAKMRRYQRILGTNPDAGTIELISLRDLPMTDVPDVPLEEGLTAEENARIKARHYAACTHLPTFSVDEALFIAGFRPEEQPGVFVRRYTGKELSDEALLEIMLNKIYMLSAHERTAHWTFAMCLAFPTGACYTRQVEIPVIFTDRPHFPLVQGYPLSALTLDPRSGKPLHELTPEENEARLQPVYHAAHRLLQSVLPQHTAAHSDEKPSTFH